MSQELEIEYKNMLSEEEFSMLCRKFSVDPASFFRQVNNYFDTPTYGLREKKSALRIRHVDGKHDLTFKQPHGDAILETHQLLTDDESRELIQFGVMPGGDVEKAIDALGIDVDQLVHIGALMTDRAEFSYKNGKLFLDHSHYLNHNDFEVEYEATDAHEGARVFGTLLHACAIARRPSKNKILRLYEALHDKGDDLK